MMKATAGDKIKVTRDVCYGSAYGLTKVKKGTVLTVSGRNDSDDGIVSVETITLKNELGSVTRGFNVWDTEYELV
ncbi:hypothetical protein JMA_40250 (plasmid) [Jeotgalibacillus malaysiensis]|uniref:Uncharacterized protein n=1 Tax=Jeotgalibacillus malaysiensis TaxID=1508404 RepID=A0A0B5AXT5_9BACL|nr:hypothetical protein JMA_40250 [Jeotgalibacillus malaysiensis]